MRKEGRQRVRVAAPVLLLKVMAVQKAGRAPSQTEALPSPCWCLLCLLCHQRQACCCRACRRGVGDAHTPSCSGGGGCTKCVTRPNGGSASIGVGGTIGCQLHAREAFSAHTLRRAPFLADAGGHDEGKDCSVARPGADARAQHVNEAAAVGKKGGRWGGGGGTDLGMEEVAVAPGVLALPCGAATAHRAHARSVHHHCRTAWP